MNADRGGRRHAAPGIRGLTCSGVALLLAVAAAAAHAAPQRPPWLAPCRVDAFPTEALCGRWPRPLDPARPEGPAIHLRVVVLPSLARRPLPDPVVMIAGGPGQSAVRLAAPLSQRVDALRQRRDLVFVEQRGTGESAPLDCAPPAATGLAQRLDPELRLGALVSCRQHLRSLPHGDLTQYTTLRAAEDLDAVREALGAPQVNLVAVSYGTRVALAVDRLFPGTVRRMVLDGVAPGDMSLPSSAGIDAAAALDRWLAACAADAGCDRRHPRLQARWAGWVAALPRTLDAEDPRDGARERLVIDRDRVAALVRAPLYQPALAAALPHALGEATHDRLAPLLGLADAAGGSAAEGPGRIAWGMHLSVICSEDAGPPGREGSEPTGAMRAGPRASASPDGVLALDLGGAGFYRRACDGWPRAALPRGWHEAGRAGAVTLLLSGALDPATPPRHAERVAAALGPRARHLVVSHAGHGVMALPCATTVVRDFVAAADDVAALSVDATCLATVPSPRPFLPPRPGAAAAS
ncbi:MAG: alpha/beta hydrolase [Rubrivivax sp.]|jgi:pimeloyl-ACP methyl ester carboxylesterase|nr:alpha/beta hydrolase [Rubrivivax sp.]